MDSARKGLFVLQKVCRLWLKICVRACVHACTGMPVHWCEIQKEERSFYFKQLGLQWSKTNNRSLYSTVMDKWVRKFLPGPWQDPSVHTASPNAYPFAPIYLTRMSNSFHMSAIYLAFWLNQLLQLIDMNFSSWEGQGKGFPPLCREHRTVCVKKAHVYFTGIRPSHKVSICRGNESERDLKRIALGYMVLKRGIMSVSFLIIIGEKSICL